MNNRITSCLIIFLLSLLLQTHVCAVTASWTGSGDGTSWHQAANWSGGVVPPAGSDVTISVPASNPTILFTSSAGTVQINSLSTSEKMTISGGTLQVATTFQTSQNIALSGGTIKGGTITSADGATLQVLGGSAVTFDGITLVSDLTLQNAASLNVKNGLTLNNAKITLAGTHYLSTTGIYFQGTQTLGGTGEVIFAGSDNGTWYSNRIYAQGNGTQAGAAALTIGAGISMHGTTSVLIAGQNTYDSILNLGSIAASGAGSITGINGIWENDGVITLSGTASLNLGGNFTLAKLGTLTRTGGTLNIGGSLDITGTTLALNAATGSWNFYGGASIKGGTVTSADGATLQVLGGNTVTLDGITLASDVTVQNEGSLNVKNGLTLNNVKVTLANTYSFGTTGLYFQGTQTLGGTGEVVFAGNGSGTNRISSQGNNTQAGAAVLTIGPGITIQGTQGGLINGYYAYDSVINQGTINVNAAGRTTSINGNWENDGTITLSGTASLNLGGNFTLAKLGTLTRTGGTLNIGGSLDITGTTLALNAATGSWNLSGGMIKGGTINASGGAKLILTPSGGTLDGVTLNGDLDMTAGSVYASVINGLTLNGTATFGFDARLLFNGSQTLGGTGMVVFQNFATPSAPALVTNTTGMTLTIGPGITVRGGGGSNFSGTIGSNTYWGGGDNTSLVLQGTINADIAGMGIRLSPKGTGTLTNTGTINLSNGGSLYVGGNITLASLGIVNRSGGGTFNLWGVLDNAGTTINLDASTGSWRLLGGTIKGGTINTSGGAKLVLTTSGGTLDGVTLKGDLDMTAGSVYASVINGLTLNGTATLGFDGRLYFNGSQTLGGTGTVVFQNFATSSAPALVTNTAGMTLTIGPGITVRGGGGSNFSGTIGSNTYWGGGDNTSLVLQGTINADIAGMGIRLSPKGPGTLTNTGTINLSNGGSINLGGNYSTASLGTINSSGSGTVTLQGVLDNTGATINLNQLTGSRRLSGVTIKGGTINASGGAKLVLTSAGGTLDGVTLNGDLDLTAGSVYANILNGLTLNGTATFGYDARLLFNGTQTLGGTGTVVFQNLNNSAPSLVANANGMTLTLGPGITVRGGGTPNYSGVIGSGTYWGGGTNVSLVLQGTINADTAASTITLKPVGTGTLTNTGAISASNGGSLRVLATLTNNTGATVNQSITSSLLLTGSLLGTTTEILFCNPQGTTTFNGAGTAAAPQLLEAMSLDQSTLGIGSNENFVFGTLALTNNTYVKLVDQSDNSGGANADAVYAESIIVPAGCTLDLNGLNLYARAVQQVGTVLNGTITQIADGGTLPLAAVIPGSISVAGQLDEWTFFGRAGKSMSVLLNPGSTGSPVPVSPLLQWATVQLVRAGNTVLATATGSSAGAPLSLTNVILPAEGTYRIRVTAAASHAASTGNYLISLWDATPNSRSLNLGQSSAGNITTPFVVDQWNFSAAAGQQVQFLPTGASSSGIAFKLIGPGGVVVFQDISSGTDLINLPAAGNYTLSAYGLNGTTGRYAFVLNQTGLTVLPPDTTYQGTWAGSGQAQLFTIPVTNINPLSVILTDANTANHTELYLRFGAPPTRQTFDFGASGPGSSHRLLVPSATVGTWYVLAYGESIPSGSGSFTLSAPAGAVVLTGTSTTKSVSNQETTLTLTGAGFNSGTQVSIVASNGTVIAATSANTDLPTQITAKFAAGSIPAGSYTIRVSQTGGASAQLDAPLIVAATGQGVLTTSLDVPNPIGRHAATTLYVNYANTGNAPMPAPLLMVGARTPQQLSGAKLGVAYSQVMGTSGSSFSWFKKRRTRAVWTSAQPINYHTYAHILASGATPVVLAPGESRRVPIDYAGWDSSQWDFNRPYLTFSLATIKADDTTPVDWASKEASMQPPGIPAAAWHVMYSAILPQLGTTSGGYVRLLDDNCAYLGRQGLQVTDVNKLWGFIVAQSANAWPSPTFGSTTDDSLPTPGLLSLSFSRAFNNSIPGRFRSGILGFGWFTPWEQSLSVATDGTVTITSGSGSRASYQPDSRYAGQYFSMDGDNSTFTAITGGYLLTAVNGTSTVFKTDGTLNYLQDTNGNRITAGYTSGRLTSLTTTSGKSFTLAYNAAGRLSTLTDSIGRVTTYSYDASNQHFTSVSRYDGLVTTYAYNTTSGAAAENALTSISFPDGTHQYCTYDAAGRLAGTSADGGSLSKTFSYTHGQVSITDALANTSSLYFDQHGQMAKTVDALGNPTYFTHDANFNLVGITNAVGSYATYSYDEFGKATAITDFLGNTNQFVYAGPQHQLTALIDAKGNTTQYSYNAKGSLLSTTYANGKTKLFTYDPLGNALSFVNEANEPIQYTHNAAGQLASATFPEGSSYTYAYNSQGLMTSATDATGTTAFTYEAVTNRLTRVAYPNNLWLDFTYDAGGRRTSMADQTGFTTR